MLTYVEEVRLANVSVLRSRRPLVDDPGLPHLFPEITAAPTDRSPESLVALIDDDTAQAIELAFGLTAGWLSIPHTLTDIEKLRLLNFHMLNGTLAQKSKVKVSDLLSRRDADRGTAREGDTRIDEKTASDVEEAYGLPPGWLSREHK